jgi:hypothetical protein
VEGRLNREFGFGTVEVALMVDRTTDQLTDRSETAIRGFVSWSRRFSTR